MSFIILNLNPTRLREPGKRVGKEKKGGTLLSLELYLYADKVF